MKLTAWYSGDQKPVRKGFYERDFSSTGSRWHVRLSRWNGESFIGVSNIGVKSFYQNLPWRGLTEEVKS